MTRKKRTAINRITGVTYKKQTGEILRIWYGVSGDNVIDVKHSQKCQYSAFTRRFKPLKQVDEKDIKKAIREARKWLKSSSASN